MKKNGVKLHCTLSKIDKTRIFLSLFEVCTKLLKNFNSNCEYWMRFYNSQMAN